MKSIHNAILGIIFIIIIFGIMIANIITPDKKFSENENRYLSTSPKFSVEKLVSGRYTKDIEKYIDDQFIMREKWIVAKSNIEQLLPRKDINGVYLGKDNYLIEKHLDKDFSYTQLDNNIAIINSFSKEYEQLNVDLMVVPTSGLIMKSKLPSNAPQFDQQKVLDDIKNKITSSNYIDITGTLSSHSNEYIYYKTDHHWTSLGAYYAYVAYCKSTGKKYDPYESWDIENAATSFRGTLYSKVLLNGMYDDISLYKSKQQNNYKVYYNFSKTTGDSVFNYDKLDEKDQYQIFFGGNHGELRIVNEEKNSNNLLVIKDSYANCFVPLIMNQFGKVCMIDLRYFNSDIDKYIQENNITDVLFLYGIMNFSNDTGFRKLQ
ncbi:DHHW family protein [Vallitalea maricola]|uniref:DHHW family protein n=1 Tax=Vallitalea maricola TaxID=3074433 RepID=A0ACB5UHX7_9FIRM|nr:DHHW family protein [Vallitalea sp. AN17-2]